MSNDQKLDSLFVEYRAACPETEASANFMPNLWAKIEARRRSETFVWRWANAFASATLMIVMLLGVLLYQQRPPEQYRSYIQKLTDEISEDHFLEAAYVAKVKPGRYGSGN